MKAARFHGPGDIRIDDVPEPQTGPGQVKVDVEWCGICGTDLHEYLEGPIFIRSYLPSLTRSERFMLIAVGMSCVSGSTMVAYATILKDVLPNVEILTKGEPKERY